MTGRRLRLGSGVARLLPAGVVDAGLASLATFVTGLAGVNLLGDTQRGVYAVFFTAFGLGTVLPNQLGYGPTEIMAVEEPVGDRLTLLRRSVVVGTMMSALAALAVVPAVAVTAGVAESSLLVPLVVTCALTILISPTQDHLRRMLHIDGVSWRAAAVSAVQFAAAVAAITMLAAFDTPVAWIPFGALAIANACSLLAGWVLARGRMGNRPPTRTITLGHLWELGSWLFVGALAPSLTAFGVAAIVTVLAGPEAIGFAEAARIVAQPVLVLGTGLTAVLAPRVMETAIRRERRRANRVLNGYVWLVAAAAGAYALVVGPAWPFNPMTHLVPAAYDVSGLVAATIGVDVLVAAAFLMGHELAAARQQRAMAVIAVLTAPLRLAAAATAGVTGAFARTLAQGTGMSVNLVLFQRLRRRHYGTAD